MESTSLLNEVKSKMQKALEHLRSELSGVRTGRASPSLLEQLKVEAYGQKMDLRDLASINASEPRLLVVQVWDQSNISAIEKAIRDFGQGLNPTTEGNLIRVPIPPLTEERRKEMIKLVHDRAESSRIAIRQIRREAMEQIERAEKQKEISEDEKFRLSQQLQKTTEDFSSQIESQVKAKEQELLQI